MEMRGFNAFRTCAGACPQNPLNPNCARVTCTFFLPTSCLGLAELFIIELRRIVEQNRIQIVLPLTLSLQVLLSKKCRRWIVEY